jgi:SAM-dependent methyltransferase
MTTHHVTSGPICRVLDCLSCPKCYGSLFLGGNLLHCNSCGTTYPLVGEIADLRLPERRESDESAWSQHWAEENQQSAVQKFFSFYRKAVFSRTVRYFVDRYFPPRGVFVEGGSGTSETSMRVDKAGGARTLVATDIILPVLGRCHPIMDVRVCGDIFRLPFNENAIDGIWNVGVMEHFTHDEIDQVMREFHRVLRPGGRIILLWPGTDSIPQKMLRLVEKVINLRKKREKFHFHPDEISQLRSSREGRDVLLRNRFRVLTVNYGFRSLMAFKILVGEKD